MQNTLLTGKTRAEFYGNFHETGKTSAEFYGNLHDVLRQ